MRINLTAQVLRPEKPFHQAVDRPINFRVTDEDGNLIKEHNGGGAVTTAQLLQILTYAETDMLPFDRAQFRQFQSELLLFRPARLESYELSDDRVEELRNI
jgi:hypothetical protein